MASGAPPIVPSFLANLLFGADLAAAAQLLAPAPGPTQGGTQEDEREAAIAHLSCLRLVPRPAEPIWVWHAPPPQPREAPLFSTLCYRLACLESLLARVETLARVPPQPEEATEKDWWALLYALQLWLDSHLLLACALDEVFLEGSEAAAAEREVKVAQLLPRFAPDLDTVFHAGVLPDLVLPYSHCDLFMHHAGKPGAFQGFMNKVTNFKCRHRELVQILIRKTQQARDAAPNYSFYLGAPLSSLQQSPLATAASPFARVGRERRKGPPSKAEWTWQENAFLSRLAAQCLLASSLGVYAHARVRPPLRVRLAIYSRFLLNPWTFGDLVTWYSTASYMSRLWDESATPSQPARGVKKRKRTQANAHAQGLLRFALKENMCHQLAFSLHVEGYATLACGPSWRAVREVTYAGSDALRGALGQRSAVAAEACTKRALATHHARLLPHYKSCVSESFAVALDGAVQRVEKEEFYARLATVAAAAATEKASGGKGQGSRVRADEGAADLLLSAQVDEKDTNLLRGLCSRLPLRPISPLMGERSEQGGAALSPLWLAYTTHPPPLSVLRQLEAASRWNEWTRARLEAIARDAYRRGGGECLALLATYAQVLLEHETVRCEPLDHAWTAEVVETQRMKQVFFNGGIGDASTEPECLAASGTVYTCSTCRTVHNPVATWTCSSTFAYTQGVQNAMFDVDSLVSDDAPVRLYCRGARGAKERRKAGAEQESREAVESEVGGRPTRRNDKVATRTALKLAEQAMCRRTQLSTHACFAQAFHYFGKSYAPCRSCGQLAPAHIYRFAGGRFTCGACEPPAPEPPPEPPPGSVRCAYCNAPGVEDPGGVVESVQGGAGRKGQWGSRILYCDTKSPHAFERAFFCPLHASAANAVREPWKGSTPWSRFMSALGAVLRERGGNYARRLTFAG